MLALFIGIANFMSSYFFEQNTTTKLPKNEKKSPSSLSKQLMDTVVKVRPMIIGRVWSQVSGALEHTELLASIRIDA